MEKPRKGRAKKEKGSVRNGPGERERMLIVSKINDIFMIITVVVSKSNGL